MSFYPSKSQTGRQEPAHNQIAFYAALAIAIPLFFCLLVSDGLAAKVVSDGLAAKVVRLPKVQPAPLPHILEAKGPLRIQSLENLTANRPLTIDEFQQMAMASNPTLVQAEQQVRAMKGTQCQVGLYPNPSIGWLAEEMGNGGQAGRQGIGFSQEIVTGNKLCLNRTTAKRAVWAAEAQLRAQQRRVENDVRMAALSVLAFQEQIEILEKWITISNDVLKVTKQLVQAKEVSRADLLKAEIEAHQTTLALQTARRNYQATWQKLVGLIGRPDLPQTKIEGTLEKKLPILTWEASLQRLLMESPQLQEVDAKIGQARWELKRQCAERKSNIDVAAAVAYNDDSEYTEATLEVMVPLKLYNRNQGNIMRARAELMIAQQERDRICLVLHNRLVEVFREYKIAQLEVTAYRKTLLPKAKESLELTGKGFRQRELSYLELLTAQQTYFSICVNYMDSLELLWISATRIEGLLLSDGLDTPP